MAFPYCPDESALVLNRAGFPAPETIFAILALRHDQRSGLRNID
jgi:hypothetical protein